MEFIAANYQKSFLGPMKEPGKRAESRYDRDCIQIRYIGARLSEEHMHRNVVGHSILLV